MLKEWKKYVKVRGGLTKITGQEYITLVDEFKLYWYEKSHKELPDDYYEILEEFRINWKINPNYYENERVVYVDGNGNYEDLPQNRRALTRFDPTDLTNNGLNQDRKLIKLGDQDRKLIKLGEEAHLRNGYFSEVTEIQSPGKKRRGLLNEGHFVDGYISEVKEIQSPGKKRRVLLNERDFVNGNSQIITTEEIASPGIRGKVLGHKEVTSPYKSRVVYQDEEIVKMVSKGSKQVTYVKQPSVVYVENDRLDNRHSYVVKTDSAHQHAPGKVRRSNKIKYDNVMPRVQTNLINDPNEVIREMQVDHGFKHDAEMVFAPGKQVTKTPGVYATSKPLSHGHVGLNKVNPIYEKLRNSEQTAAQKIQFAWKQRDNRYTGEKDQPQLLVHEEVFSPTKASGRSQERTYTIADAHYNNYNQPSVVYVDGDRLDNRHSYVVTTDKDQQFQPGKVIRSNKIKYDNVMPRVQTNLINDPNEVIREMQVDHGYKHDAEMVFSPGKQVVGTSGVYATSKPLSHGHVGLNKVNPIYEKARNSEQIADQKVQFAWKNRNNRFTGEKDQPQLLVHEEVSPTKIPGRSQERTYTIADRFDNINSMAQYIYKTGSPDRFNQPQYHERIPVETPVEEESKMTFDEFSKQYNQFESFKKGLGANITEKSAIKLFQAHLLEGTPKGRKLINSVARSTISRNGSKEGSRINLH